MAAPVPPGAPRPGNNPPNYNPNIRVPPDSLTDNMQNLNLNKPPMTSDSVARPPSFGQSPPFPSSVPSPAFAGISPLFSRPGPPPGPPLQSQAPSSVAPQGMMPSPSSTFGTPSWPGQQQQAPRMFGMPPRLPNQSMTTTIPPAVGQTGAPMARPSKIDPNQIPRPAPGSSVILHETRQGNQATIPPVIMNINEAVKNIFHWDGTLSSSDFFLAACAFSEKWKKFNPAFPPWLWVPCSKHEPVSSHELEGYLSLENMSLFKSNEEEQGKESLMQKEESNISEEEEPFDYATLVQNSCHEVKHYDFHVVYSASYRVPVLYFHAYHSDGKPLLFNEIETDLPSHSAKLLSESKWTFITQEEHPYLNRPWYKLHPCGTSEWMKLLFLGDTCLTKNGLVIEQYLVSWFSVIGQVIGLKIPLGMLDIVVPNCSLKQIKTLEKI